MIQYLGYINKVDTRILARVSVGDMLSRTFQLVNAFNFRKLNLGAVHLLCCTIQGPSTVAAKKNATFNFANNSSMEDQIFMKLKN